jgi:hypothetical protein
MCVFVRPGSMVESTGVARVWKVKGALMAPAAKSNRLVMSALQHPLSKWMKQWWWSSSAQSS